jgi:tetratricopeptide (TPR) repeat protein
MPGAALIDDLLRIARSPEGERAALVSALGLTASRVFDACERLRELTGDDLAGALGATEMLCLGLDGIDSAAARARVLSVRAHALNYANRFDEAVGVAERAASAAGEAGEPLEVARARMTLVHALARLGRLDDALDAALDAERAFLDAGETQQAVRAVTNAGIVTRMRGDAAAAIERFDRALGLGPDAAAVEAQIRNCRAEALLDAGRFGEAEAEFGTAAAMLEGAGVRRTAAIVRGNLADLFGRQGRWAEALEQFESARRFFEKDAAYGDLGRILVERADVLGAIGLLDDAAGDYRRASLLLERAGLAAERARALLGLGRVTTERDPAEAAERLDEARGAFEGIGNPAAAASAGLALAAVLRLDGERARAADELDRAEAALADRPIERVLAAMTRGDLRVDAGDYDEAERVFTDAIARAEGLGLTAQIVELLARRAEARERAGRRGEAAADLADALGRLERVRGALPGARFRAGLLGGHRRIYDAAIGFALDAGDAAGAFALSERARGRTLLDALGRGFGFGGSADGNGDRDGELRAELDRAHADLNAVYAVLDPTAGGATHQEWLKRLESFERRVQELESRLLTSGKANGERAQTTAAEIGAALAEDQALVSYWVTRDAVRAWIVRRDGVEAVDLDVPAAVVEDAAQRVLFQMRSAIARGPRAAERRRGACDGALDALGSMVWGAVAERLDGVGRVAVVPAGPLHAVPFPALRCGGRHVIEDRECVLLPSAAVLPHLAGVGEASSDRTVLVGVADELAPDIEREVRRIHEALPGAEVFAGASATAEAVRGAVSGAAALLIEQGKVRRADDFETFAKQATRRISQLNPGLDGDALGEGALDLEMAVAWAGPCFADLTDDGMVTFADVTRFIDLFIGNTVDGLPDEDVDYVAPRGAWTFADIVFFLDAFAAGCP